MRTQVNIDRVYEVHGGFIWSYIQTELPFLKIKGISLPWATKRAQKLVIELLLKSNDKDLAQSVSNLEFSANKDLKELIKILKALDMPPVSAVRLRGFDADSASASSEVHGGFIRSDIH
jgi:hypothetical protein